MCGEGKGGASAWAMVGAGQGRSSLGVDWGDLLKAFERLAGHVVCSEQRLVDIHNSRGQRC